MKFPGAIFSYFLFSSAANAQGLTPRAPGISTRQGDCGAFGLQYCGTTCIGPNDICCRNPDFGCPQGTYCFGTGCCPIGSVCSGEGSISTETLVRTDTLTNTLTNTIPVVSTTVVTTSAVVTTPAVYTTTSQAPTTTGPVASYTPGSANVASAMYGEHQHALLVGCSIVAALVTLMAGLL